MISLRNRTLRFEVKIIPGYVEKRDAREYDIFDKVS